MSGTEYSSKRRQSSSKTTRVRFCERFKATEGIYLLDSDTNARMIHMIDQCAHHRLSSARHAASACQRYKHGFPPCSCFRNMRSVSDSGDSNHHAPMQSHLTPSSAENYTASAQSTPHTRIYLFGVYLKRPSILPVTPSPSTNRPNCLAWTAMIGGGSSSDTLFVASTLMCRRHQDTRGSGAVCKHFTSV